MTTATAPNSTLTVEGEPLAGPSLLDELLAERDQLTAAQRFAQAHADSAPEAEPAQARYYRELMPASQPGPGQQYRFDVDLDACSGCKACVTACHSLNGLDPGETFRDVGQLVPGHADPADNPDGEHRPLDGMIDALPRAQHVTTACHHCVEPACMHGCPVNAYDKDPVTGIVRHLDDQCIGCQYCVLKCPYDVPKYNKRLGIVRKCDMCADRLAEDEAPACAQACPTQAIAIRLVDVDESEAEAEAGRFVAGAPGPGYTVPTTRYRRAERVVSMRPADAFAGPPEHAHWPLIWMLVLTQLSVGGFLMGQLLPADPVEAGAPGVRPLHAAIALGLGLVALGASVLHLGRPLYAFRAVIGLRRSWLSREVVGFGGFAKVAGLYAAAAWFGHWAAGPLAWATVGAGLAAVFCSVMVYHDTRRALWHIGRSGPLFLLTTLVLGSATTLTALLLAAAWAGQDATAALSQAGRPLLLTILVAGLAKLALEAKTLTHLADPGDEPMGKSARRLTGPLSQVAVIRTAVGLAGMVILPALLLLAGAGNPSAAVALGGLILALSFAGEVLERYLFFTAVVAPKMPGGSAS